MDEVSKDIRDYIETEIMPKYDGVGGHTDKHIQQVITRSLRFAKQAPGVNINMVYVIAAYHDLGRLVDDETHNIESAKMMREDEFLKSHFSADEIETMAEAVEDHRASLGHEPRSVYGKIVSSADRNANVKVMLGRVYDYAKYLHPEMTEDEIIEEARIQLRRKYSPDGYAAKTMYFNDPKFAGALKEVEEVTRDFETFAKAIHDNNEKDLKNKEKKMDKICQSCAMPLASEDLYATEKDGSVNEDYCKWCYKDGEFIDKCSMEEYIEKCSQFGEQAGMTNEQMREYCTKVFPTLKRWKKAE